MTSRIPSIYASGDGTYSVEHRGLGQHLGQGLTLAEAEAIVAEHTALLARVEAGIAARRRPRHGVRDDTDLSGF